MLQRAPAPILWALARAASGLALVACLAASVPAAGQPPTGIEFAREPPEKIVTAEACGECHLSAFEVWKETHHAGGFQTLHRTEVAQRIARKLGHRLLKRGSPCLSCHYTAVVQGGQLRAASGVSCESCHGAARDWIRLHNDYGKGVERTGESADHRRQRVAASRAAGMRRPSDLYPLAASCFGCHTVADARLVDVGGHSVGSVGFELVEWSQGKMRHNFLASFLTGDGTVNVERTPAEKRTRYVLGRALGLEYSLRGMADARDPGNYSRAMARRVQMALIEVRKIASRAAIPQVEAMIAAVGRVRVVPNNRAALLAAAEEVGKETKRFLARHDAARLASLDPLVQGLAEPEPTLDEALAQVGGEGAGTGAAGAGGEGSQPAVPGRPAEAGAQAAPPAGPASRGRAAVGAFKRRIRPAAQHKTVGPLACSGSSCHEVPNRWWATDAHYRSAEPFFNRTPANLKIARLYGLEPAEITRGSRVCMDCHGTVILGNEAFDVFDGVSCESCHGPAKDYLKPHNEGDKTLGDKRPGYLEALKLGMVELRDPTVLAQRCTGCHYITDPRLLSAGHPSGEDFDPRQGMAEIDHWQHPPTAAAGLESAFRQVLAARGPVPRVELARLPEGEETALARSAAPGTPTRLAAATGSTWNRPRPALPSPASPGPTPSLPSRRLGDLELPPFPEINASTPYEEILLLLKERLELLYRAVGSQAGGKP